MEINPVAIYRCPVSGKFGLPRQSGVAPSLEGEIILLLPYSNPDALRGLEGFSHIWVIWEFSKADTGDGTFKATVRPPRLGGNERLGVFATRSPFRPNRLGLSCLKILGIVLDAKEGPTIKVGGGDLMDGTPVYDIKPYIPYADRVEDASEGFTATQWKSLEVDFPLHLKRTFTSEEAEALTEILSQDPRPHYHDDPHREYALTFKGHDVRFLVTEGKAFVIGVTEVYTPER